MPDFMKIRLVEAEFFYANRQRETDRGQTDGETTKLVVCFRNFANAPKNQHSAAKVP